MLEVLSIIACYLEKSVIFVLLFAVQKYVLLEKTFEKKKQIRYCIITYIISMIVVTFSPDVGDMLMLFFCGLNSFLTRTQKEKKMVGFLMTIPNMGLLNGTIGPILYLPAALYSSKDLMWEIGDSFVITGEYVITIYHLLIYSIVMCALIVFGAKGKAWREKFDADMKNRRLQKWELGLACVSGILLTIYALIMPNSFEMNPTNNVYVEMLYSQLRMNQLLVTAISVILSVMTVVLIMQGNKRAYYYDKALAAKDLEIEKQKAEAANEAKSSFLSTMSHEIRTPMNAIVGMTDILLREEHTPQTKEYLHNIKSSGNALLSIINDILDFSKIESGKMEIVEERYEPMSIFHDLSMIFHNRIDDKKVELLYDIDPKMPHKLYGDAQRIRQIILNLMNNAIKFTDEGFVKLKVEVTPLDMENVEFCLKIQDSGQGIKEEDIKKLFGSFSQVDKLRNHHKEGSGLGLAICKQLVELMKGTIWVESTYGEGSTFSFKIPQRIVDVKEAAKLKTDKARNSVIGIKMDNEYAGKEAADLAKAYGIKCVDLKKNPTEKTDYIILETNKPLTEKEYAELEKSGGKLYILRNPMKETVCIRNAAVLTKPLYSLNFCQLLNGEEFVKQTVETEQYQFLASEAKILLVDDNDMNLKVAKGLLASFKIHIDVAKNGKEAIQKVLANQYHIVFMDHMMPVMDGVEATKAIRKLQGGAYKELPIVALSANATSEAREMFLKEQMSDFVAKPIRMKEITECLLRWLPEEIVQYEKNDSLSAEAEVKDVQGDDGLPVINGLNVAEGIKNCGSVELFYELLSDFYKLIDIKSEKVENCLKEGLIRDYTIEVHALKSMARMIGALELSEQFYQMEMLGNAGETELIEKRTPDILGLYRSYKEVLKDHIKNGPEEKTAVSYEQVEKTLVRLHDAMDGFDLDEADEAMKELENYDLPDDIKTMVEKLGVLVTDVAMEEVMALSDEICEKLALKADKDVETEGAGRPKVMLIDDDSINRKAVTSMLKDEFEVIAAASGKEAFEMLSKEKADLILLDVYMPEMDGHEVIKTLKGSAEYADIPVIFLTSDVEETTEIKGFSEGAIDFLRKPFRKNVAIQRIRRILELSYLQKYLQKEVERQTEVAESRRESVERLSWQMVQALASTIDAKDSYTNGHSTRVAQYSVMLAEKMGYTGEKLEQLQYAAMLHDIGKIGVPREIINKPSKLTDEEYAIIKTHPAIGENILKEVSEIPDIAIGARWHHERYDGKGYPDGMKGEAIPELARIIGVADAYDAMTSKRSYRDVLPQEVVIGELEKGKSTQFDPEIAEIMIELIKEDTDYIMHE